jgi:hypothetical protein
MISDQAEFWSWVERNHEKTTLKSSMVNRLKVAMKLKKYWIESTE